MSNPARIPVLVTGVGAVIGQGIVKSLRGTGRSLFILGVDRNDRSPGTHMVDLFCRKPSSEEGSDYLHYWAQLTRTHAVRLIIPGLEVDVAFFDRNRDFFDGLGVKVALNQSKLIEEATDKWLFSERLRLIGYPVIPSTRTEDWNSAIGLLGPAPLLLKPLIGSGSRGIVQLEDEHDFTYWKRKLTQGWMLQRIVGSNEEEYTVGVFGYGDGGFAGPIVFRRRLSGGGSTVEAEVVQGEVSVEAATRVLCQHFCPRGPTNLQFRLEKGVPYLLEINPRFSSSNSLRTAFGFNEAEMTLEYYLEGRLPVTPRIRNGTGWRFAEDHVVYAGPSV